MHQGRDSGRPRTSPTVWVCSASCVYDTNAPLPLILADEPSILRRLGLSALEPTRLWWRTNYLAPSLVGIRAAVRAGLGVTARSIEMLGPDMRVLGAAEGLPPLPDITYYRWTRGEPLSATTQQVYGMPKINMGLNESGAVTRSCAIERPNPSPVSRSNVFCLGCFGAQYRAPVGKNRWRLWQARDRPGARL